MESDEEATSIPEASVVLVSASVSSSDTSGSCPSPVFPLHGRILSLQTSLAARLLHRFPERCFTGQKVQSALGCFTNPLGFKGSGPKTDTLLCNFHIHDTVKVK